MQVNNIPGIEEVNMIKDDGSVIHFNNPKVRRSDSIELHHIGVIIAISSDPKLHNDFSLQVQASLAANTFAVTGHAENKQITELLPGILNQVTLSFITYSDSSKLNF